MALKTVLMLNFFTVQPVHLHDTFKPEVHIKANTKRKQNNAVFWENPFVPFSYCPYIQVFLKLAFVLVFYFQTALPLLCSSMQRPKSAPLKPHVHPVCCIRMQGYLTPAHWIELIFSRLQQRHVVSLIKGVCSPWTYFSLSVPCPLSHSPPTHSLEVPTLQICHGLCCNLVKW